MAHGLLDGSEALHLYRHDVESLFYIMLILTTHYDVRAPTKEKDGGLRTRQDLKDLPYQAWFDQPSYKTLASFKKAFFSDLEYLNLSPTFGGFRDWLGSLHLSFRRGRRSKQTHEDELISLRQHGTSEGGIIPPFDDETLGGYVDYSALINPVRSLTGKLEGLVIRYDPPPPPPLVPTGAIRSSWWPSLPFSLPFFSA